LVGVEPAKFVNPAYSEHEVWELDKETWQAAAETREQLSALRFV